MKTSAQDKEKFEKHAKAKREVDETVANYKAFANDIFQNILNELIII